MLKAGVQVKWIQGGNGSLEQFGHEMVGSIICPVKKGESMFKVIRKHGFKPKSYTTDCATTFDRYLVKKGEGIYDFGTPRTQNVYEAL